MRFDGVFTVPVSRIHDFNAGKVHRDQSSLTIYLLGLGQNFFIS